LRELNKDREFTAQEVQQRALGQTKKANPKTIRRILRRYGFSKVKARAIPRLSYMQQLQRRKWAREFRNYDWSRVAFTDEKRWSKRPDGSAKVWMRPGESRDPRCCKKVTKFGGGGLMVWGAISPNKEVPPNSNSRHSQCSRIY
jgi:hypothetical protein